MIIIKVSPNLTVGLSFKHEDAEVEIPNTNPIEYRTAKTTFCEIFEVVGKNTKWLCEGQAVLGVGDQFRKAIGRKYSLARALKKLPNLTRLNRTIIWEGYHKRGELKPEAYEVH